MSHPSQIAFHTLKEKIFFGMPSDLLIVVTNKYSHHPDCVNFSHPQITILVVEPNMVEDVLIQ